jgi:hypothetical protein
MDALRQRALEVYKQHGGWAQAARALRINRTVLWLLATGQRKSCGPETLKALGLKPSGYEPIKSE